MTPDSLPTCDELAAAVKQFRSENINPSACTSLQAKELTELSSTPPENLTVYKDGSRSLVGKHILSDGSACALKYYNPRNLAKKINYRLRGSRAMCSWVAARTFDLLNIPTASAMMIRENVGSSGLTIRQSFLASNVAPGIPLSDVTDLETLHDIASQLSDAFTRMASYHISHGDLKANNIVVSDDGKIHFIDLDGVSILTKQNKWKNLWERDRARFLRNWPTEHPFHQILSNTIQPA